MDNSFLISVIMPAYNAEKYIEQAIECILNQTYANWELLIADDGSTDDTGSIINEYVLKDSRIKFYKNETNIGNLKTWNNLIACAQGECITFLDADDLCSLDRIYKLCSYLQEHPDIKIVGSHIRFIDSGGNVTGGREYPTCEKQIKNSLLLNKFPFCAAAIMIKREVYQKVGGFREYFDRLDWADHDWIIRCCTIFKSANIDQYLYSYRDNPKSLSRSIQPQDYKKLIIKKIGQELAKQRIQTGTDCLEQGDYAKLNEIEKKYQKPFDDNPALVYLKLSAMAATKKIRKNYLIQAIKIKPFQLKAYYYLLKTF